MKRSYIFVAALVLIGMGVCLESDAGIIYSNDCTTLGNGLYTYTGTPSLVPNVSQGTTDIKLDAWSSTVANSVFAFNQTVEANTKYIATVQLQQWGGVGYTAQDMLVSIKARDVPGAWQTYPSAQITVTPTLSSENAPGAYGTYILELDTAVVPEAVGRTQMLVQFQEVEGWSQIAVGDIKVEAIPEPATLGMVAMMGGGLLIIRRRLQM